MHSPMSTSGTFRELLALMDDVSDVVAAVVGPDAAPAQRSSIRFAARAFGAMTVVLVKRQDARREFLTVREMEAVRKLLEHELKVVRQLSVQGTRPISGNVHSAEINAAAPSLLNVVFSPNRLEGCLVSETALALGEFGGVLELMIGDHFYEVLLKTLSTISECTDSQALVS